MAGLSNTGLTIKRLPDVITDLKTQAEQIFADLLPAGDTVDTSDDTTIGRMIGLVAPSQADLWEAIQQVYDSYNPNAATGYSLDNMISLSGITRYGSEPTRASCLFEGSNNTLLGLASKVSSSTTQRIFSLGSTVSLNQYQASGIGISIATVANSTAYTIGYSSDGISYTNVSITSDSSATSAEILTALKTAFDTTTGGTFVTYYQDGYLFINRTDPFQTVSFSNTPNITVVKCIKLGIVNCDEIGPLPQLAGTIDTIAVPALGWDKVTNPLDAAEGRYEETDEELRERFRNSKFFQAANILESLVDALRNVEDVADVVVYENDTDTTNGFGVPPHSFMPIVLGGLPTTIGQAIWQNKPTGIRSYGSTTVVVTDSQGIGHSISYKTPTPVPVYMTVSITNTGAMPGDVVAKLKEAILSYGNSNFSIGDDVVYSRLYTPINSVSGFQVNTMFIGVTASPSGTSNIVVDFDKVATWDASRITITVV
jgi:uncharacterized phage protein gp47/JayE